MDVNQRRQVHKCLRCDWDWMSFIDKPVVCPRCHTVLWDVPRKYKVPVKRIRQEQEHVATI